jgi:hypothetical protein
MTRLAAARTISRSRSGKWRASHLEAAPLREAADWIERYRFGGRLQEGIEPFETRLRGEFYDEAGGRTRLEIGQWLPEHLAQSSEAGWRQAFTKPGATHDFRSVAANHREAEAWQS